MEHKSVNDDQVLCNCAWCYRLNECTFEKYEHYQMITINVKPEVREKSNRLTWQVNLTLANQKNWYCELNSQRIGSWSRPQRRFAIRRNSIRKTHLSIKLFNRNFFCWIKIFYQNQKMWGKIYVQPQLKKDKLKTKT